MRALLNQKFKYGGACLLFPDCPPENYVEIYGEYYRFVFPCDPEKSFRPPYELVPRRALEATADCGGWALSIYQDAAKARKAYEYLFRKFKERMNDTIGDHLAVVAIELSDGKAQPKARKDGHINFHEYRDARLETKMTLIGPTIGPGDYDPLRDSEQHDECRN